jgi:hypothetical protein
MRCGAATVLAAAGADLTTSAFLTAVRLLINDFFCTDILSLLEGLFFFLRYAFTYKHSRCQSFLLTLPHQP